MAIEDAFVAGPAIKKINIDPGDRPLAKSATAMGMEAVAHTYMGIDIANNIVYCINGLDEK
tara:strand:+ start:450 stop:632 length:183 start_codon:yes stop_codon:yes gene_type:complete